jgi:hypothetical protein
LVLGVLITWLQTKASIRIHRERPGSSIDVVVEKESADPETLRAFASTIRAVLPPSDSATV